MSRKPNHGPEGRPRPLPSGSADLDPEAFRASGRRAVDWIADYLSGGAERYPVRPRTRPGEIRAAVPASPPDEPEALTRILDDFESLIAPGTTHWNHAGFLAYFAITGSAPGILGEMLSSALNVNAMLWRTGPAPTELEEVALSWLRQMLGLGEGWFGVLQDTASISSLVALTAAREAALGRAVREEGLAGTAPLRAYTSCEAHSSIEKAAITLGIGRQGLVRVPVDDQLRMEPAALEERIRGDRAAGRRPFAVVATVGTTSTTSVDPVPALAAICAREGLWLHVDAAYAGTAAVLPEMRWVLDGCEAADSLVVNPHKWLFVPFDCSALYTRRPDVVRASLDVRPDYLQASESERPEVTDLMEYGPALGRKFRALKLWMVIRALGVRGIQDALRGHLALAGDLAAKVDAHPGFERMAPAPFSLVCLRARPADLAGRESESRVAAYLDRLNTELLEAVNRDGRVLLSSTKVRGCVTLRVAIGNLRTTDVNVGVAWELLRAEAARLDDPGRRGGLA